MLPTEWGLYRLSRFLQREIIRWIQHMIRVGSNIAAVGRHEGSMAIASMAIAIARITSTSGDVLGANSTRSRDMQSSQR
jgi:hypothetical protein